MLIKTSAALGALTSVVLADSLSLYLGETCNGAPLGGYNPIPLGECISFGEAQSYVIQTDDENVYNLYSGDGCSQYEGQVSFSGCMMRSTGGSNPPSHILNIGPQPGKRSSSGTRVADIKRGLRPELSRRERISASKRGADLQARVDGDTYDCPNVPYFFVVTQSSATTDVDTSVEEESVIEGDFTNAFTRAYDQGGQTTVQSDSVGAQNEDIRITLTALQGTIGTYIHPGEADDLISDLNIFRDSQRSPAEFFVSIYTGRAGANDGVGPFANFRWVLE